MTKLFRTVAVGLSTLVAAAALSAANGTMTVSLPQTPFELPASVIEAAQTETDYTIIEDRDPAASVPNDTDTPQPRATSLSGMVAKQLSSNTGSRDEECLAIAVYFESRSESHVGQLAVAHTVINRAKSGRFPSSICGVVKQPSQFSFVRGGTFPTVPRSSLDWREAVAIAKIAQDNLWESSAPKALFFHAVHVSPRWKLKRVASVGNHIFYR